jgi:hypothetical protein
MTWWCRRFDVAISDKGATAGKSGAAETHLTLSTFTTIEEEDEEDRQRGTSIQEQDGEGWTIGTMSKKQGRSAPPSNLGRFPDHALVSTQASPHEMRWHLPILSGWPCQTGMAPVRWI